MVHLHKCLEISPTGTNPPYNAFYFLTENTANQEQIYINFEIWKQNRGMGHIFKFLIKGCIGKFRIRTTWNYLSNRAANAVIRWFNGKEGERWLRVVTRRSV